MLAVSRGEVPSSEEISVVDSITESLLIELWLLVTEVSTLSLILLTTQTMVTTGVLPLQAGIEPGTSWLVVRSSDHQTTRLVDKTYLRLHDPIVLTKFRCLDRFT